MYWIGESDKNISRISFSVTGGTMNGEIRNMLALEWKTEPPTQEGWYWAKNKHENSIEVVKVYIDDGIYEGELRVWFTGMDYSNELFIYSHWLGPLPIPEMPK